LVSRNITARGSEAYEPVKGVTAAILAATSWSLGMVFYKPAATSAGPYVAAVARMAVLTAFIAVVVAVSGRAHMLKGQGMRTWLMLGVAGLIDLGLGGTLFLVSLTMVEASKAIPLSFTSPLFATILAFALLHEKVTWRVALGAALIVMGAWTITLP
jgi:uncharacterized membrane protein